MVDPVPSYAVSDERGAILNPCGSPASLPFHVVFFNRLVDDPGVRRLACHFTDDACHSCLRVAEQLFIFEIDDILAASASVVPVHDMVTPVLATVPRAIKLILNEGSEVFDGVIWVPAIPKQLVVAFAKTALGNGVVRGEFPDPVEVERDHDIPAVPGEVKASGQSWTPVPVVMKNAGAAGWECVVFGIRQLHDFSRHFSKPCPAGFWVFTIQDVAKMLAKSWGENLVCLRGHLPHRGKYQAVVV